MLLLNTYRYVRLFGSGTATGLLKVDLPEQEVQSKDVKLGFSFDF